MSDIGRHSAIAMPPVSMACLEALGETVLANFQPSALATPEPVNVQDWIDRLLPPYGVHVIPADPAELGDCAAITYPVGESETEILVQEWVWNDIAGSGWNFARATVMHELAHAILHVPVIRRPTSEAEAAPQAGPLAPFCDPEWQAWALAGAILMPRRTIVCLAEVSARSVASVYRVSEAFAAVHLRRLKIDPSLISPKDGEKI